MKRGKSAIFICFGVLLLLVISFSIIPWNRLNLSAVDTKTLTDSVGSVAEMETKSSADYTQTRNTSPVYIHNQQELRNIDNDLAGWYILAEDITLSGNWKPIGTHKKHPNSSYDERIYSPNPFTGIFDGAGHSISGLKIQNTVNYVVEDPYMIRNYNFTSSYYRSYYAYCGLFAKIDGGAVVKNVMLQSPIINMKYQTDEYYSTTYNVGVYAGTITGDIGENGALITNVFVNNADIKVVEDNIYYCYANPAVSLVVGGISGHSGSKATITNCSVSGSIYAMGSVDPNGNRGRESSIPPMVGGIIGLTYSGTYEIRNCITAINYIVYSYTYDMDSMYSIVSAFPRVGGIVGFVRSSITIANCIAYIKGLDVTSCFGYGKKLHDDYMYKQPILGVDYDNWAKDSSGNTVNVSNCYYCNGMTIYYRRYGNTGVFDGSTQTYMSELQSTFGLNVLNS